ncbi:hypothetical protein VP01_2556g2 [Puccinia sorghi]|uniref:Uncharacterized protein n=1 Tax=Puccinia sorghi TaxID=27349 RepID=A0A0L6V5A0_9BASI|nr:hypothetical protein VP01_2556g2 [Puccinia sorghi]
MTNEYSTNPHPFSLPASILNTSNQRQEKLTSIGKTTPLPHQRRYHANSFLDGRLKESNHTLHLPFNQVSKFLLIIQWLEEEKNFGQDLMQLEILEFSHLIESLFLTCYWASHNQRPRLLPSCDPVVYTFCYLTHLNCTMRLNLLKKGLKAPGACRVAIFGDIVEQIRDSNSSSSLRVAVKHTIGILKKRWTKLGDLPLVINNKQSAGRATRKAGVFKTWPKMLLMSQIHMCRKVMEMLYISNIYLAQISSALEYMILLSIRNHVNLIQFFFTTFFPKISCSFLFFFPLCYTFKKNLMIPNSGIIYLDSMKRQDEQIIEKIKLIY